MNIKKDRLLTASIMVTLISVLGKFMGFARDAVIAAYYGADWRTDAFFLAQSMPGVVFPAVCNSLSTAFLSIYVSKCVEDNEHADLYGSRAISFSILLAVCLSIVAILLAPLFVPLFSPGFSQAQSELAIHLTRITMSAFALIMMQYMLGSVLNAKKRFYGAQIAATLYNFSIITITIVLGKSQNMDVLTYTVVLGHLIQVVSLLLFSRKYFHFSFSFSFVNGEMQHLIKLTIPIILGNSIVQINNIVDKILSSLFGDGAMSALSYSNTLNRFVTGIVITTLSTVIYPTLTEQYSKGENDSFCDVIRKSISIGIIILLPISIITLTCANDIVDIVYRRGNFDEKAALLTSVTLAFYGMMYVFAAIQEVTTRAFYSMKDTKTPLKVAAIAIFGNSITSVVLSKIMGLGGVALGTTLSTGIAAILLVFSLHKRIPQFNLHGFASMAWKLALSACILTLLVLNMKSYLEGMSVLLRFMIIVFSVFTLYFCMLLILKCREVVEIKNIFVKMFIGKRQNK